ncbi:GNAT family N-acetyltransferase [Cesiribacter sp. SM1]|uniref:GNAT family N-acetyltransferase n=1 Tax=Cesiribacter sp. SM1 TaxID=2861196 RepID=UPI001CD37E62|nr:GNAT family N-acetyltransferase [Cesiribacter sp. SM1]
MIREYTSKDKEQILELLRLNTPQYFDRSEESDFVEYLDLRVESYFVVEDQGKIIGSGGINFLDDNTEARISWDIIHPDYQGKGVGKQLTLFRIEEIKKIDAVRLIKVRTTQLVYRFYEKMGFRLEKIEKDYWAKGFDLYQLIIPLQ